MKTYNDVINETIEYYYNHPRGVEMGNGPRYITIEGCMCAIGRVLNKNHPDYSIIAASYETIDVLLHYYGIDILQRDYRHLENYNFWERLQYFHDNPNHWVNSRKANGGRSAWLSDHGSKFASSMRREFGEVQ